MPREKNFCNSWTFQNNRLTDALALIMSVKVPDNWRRGVEICRVLTSPSRQHGGRVKQKLIKNFTQNFSDGLQVGLFRGIVRLRHITLQAVVKNSHKGAKHQKPLTADLRRLAQTRK